MSNRKVQKIMPISATASSRQVEIGQTYSILSDPDGRWVAKRQEAINEGFEKRMRSGAINKVGRRQRLAAAHGMTPHMSYPAHCLARASGSVDVIGTRIRHLASMSVSSERSE